MSHPRTLRCVQGEPALGLWVQGALEVVGDQLDELLTRHRVHTESPADVEHFEAGAHSGPGPVQQDPLVGRRQLEERADLVGGEAVHVAQPDHQPLPLGQGGDQRRTLSSVSAATAASSGDGHSSGNTFQPPGYSSSGPRKRSGSTVGSPAEAAQRHGPLLAHAAGLGDVGEDPEGPGAEGRPTFEAVDPSRTPSQASCTTSSAEASVETWARATRVMTGVQLSTSCRKASSSRDRRASHEARVVHGIFIAAQRPAEHREGPVRRLANKRTQRVVELVAAVDPDAGRAAQLGVRRPVGVGQRGVPHREVAGDLLLLDLAERVVVRAARA